MLKKPTCRRLSAIVPLAVFASILFGEVPVRADAGPQPPCGNSAFPPYPDLENSPAVKAWDRAESGSDWTPPACIRGILHQQGRRVLPFSGGHSDGQGAPRIAIIRWPEGSFFSAAISR